MSRSTNDISISTVFATIALIPLVAVMAGTIVWLTWPIVIPVVIPGLVDAGYIAANISWWQSVCLTWLVGCFRSWSGTSNK